MFGHLWLLITGPISCGNSLFFQVATKEAAELGHHFWQNSGDTGHVLKRQGLFSRRSIAESVIYSQLSLGSESQKCRLFSADLKLDGLMSLWAPGRNVL